jgi:alkanesulfonate monooxygenase SsuD/methylene tetrahydromethanopterin reductase-like flavin-dependent oxidoreductase (luciferase family)
MKKIGFLSFGHWTPSPQSGTRSAADTAAVHRPGRSSRRAGADAYFRVHHFARQLSSPFPLLAAIGAKTKTIEIGTGVIDMRYENPMYMAEMRCGGSDFRRSFAAWHQPGLPGAGH